MKKIINLSIFVLMSLMSTKAMAYEKGNYIEVESWRILTTQNGIFVVDDQTYHPENIGYDKESKLYYFSSGSEVIDEMFLRTHPNLHRKICEIRRVIYQVRASQKDARPKE